MCNAAGEAAQRLNFLALQQLHLQGFLLGVRFPVYLSALAIAELPYAVGTVLAGEGVVRREGWWLVALGVLAVAFSLYAAWLLRRKLRR